MPKGKFPIEDLKRQRELIDAQIERAQNEENENTTSIGSTVGSSAFDVEWYPEVNTLYVYGSDGRICMSAIQLFALNAWIADRLKVEKTKRLASKA